MGNVQQAIPACCNRKQHQRTGTEETRRSDCITSSSPTEIKNLSRRADGNTLPWNIPLNNQGVFLRFSEKYGIAYWRFCNDPNPISWIFRRRIWNHNNRTKRTLEPISESI